ncbi:hypothetical protein COT72_04565 [archaeon CG10_big_fil_rev_8_21_14_0_10_43_11]|nr:MAG: hypothetical protein COT72_04565 [archaeon CG10_big_fil_rev_8_21_14_0_10_43_11]
MKTIRVYPAYHIVSRSDETKNGVIFVGQHNNVIGFRGKNCELIPIRSVYNPNNHYTLSCFNNDASVPSVDEMQKKQGLVIYEPTKNVTHGSLVGILEHTKKSGIQKFFFDSKGVISGEPDFAWLVENLLETQ